MFGTSMFSKPANKRMFGVFAGLALATQANAHLFLQYPAPIEGSAPKSPLLADGSNFPCHNAKLPLSGGEKFAAGSSHLIQFDDGNGANTAVHGGGSCQISVNYGDDPSKPENWFVIHSMEGGCPTNSAGNLDGEYTGPQGTYPGAIQCTDPRANGVDCINSYNFTIPNGLKSGPATLAWTWFNTIGNREMYMNCVNAHIEGGTGDEMASLPTMFVANLAKTDLPQCATTEGEFYKFPYPGKYITSNTKGSQYKLVALDAGACAKDGAPAGGAASGGSSGGGAGPSYGNGSSPSPSGTPQGQQPSGQVTVTTMKTLSGGNTAPSSAPAAPVSSAPAVSSAVPSAAPQPSSSAAGPAPYASGSTSSGAGACAAGAQPCSTDGEVVCMSGMKFGLCDNGCAVPQPLAAGTTCSNGVIAQRDHIRRHVRQFA